ncbi:MAG: uroporphyrinogen decarboxylase family protein [Smithella sp.]|nr:uroporphyrinogen decarboxylase family protein [Smithella sp.]
MSSKERVLRTLEGKPVDRVPCMSVMLEAKTIYEIKKKPLLSKIISDEKLLKLPLSKFVLDRWAPQISGLVFRPSLKKTFHLRNIGQVEMGLDAIWAYYDDTWIMLDSKSYAMPTGSIYNLIPDGSGNMSYMYSKPGITTPEEFDAWPYWPDTDDMAHSVFKYYKKFVADYGEKVCITACGSSLGLQEGMNCTFGIDKVPIWIKRHPAYVSRYLDLHEEIKMKTSEALISAGVPVIFISDDFAFKTGPFLNPKIIDSVFGPHYRRIFKYIRDKGAKVILHSCGDNTKIFDIFLSWGIDALHAYETTSDVDIFKQKELHGDRVTMIGGMGIDYLLTSKSKDEEVIARVKDLIMRLGPRGRFIVAPSNSVDSMSAHKVLVMVEAVKKYGSYPISIN